VAVRFELTRLDGTSTGLNGDVTLPANGQLSLFLSQIPGFAGLPHPFQGVLRISTTAPAGVSVVGLRGRYNERHDFIVSTTPPVDEKNANALELFLPHFVDGGQYSTQFILFGAKAQDRPSGVMRFYQQSGQSMQVNMATAAPSSTQ
jgi:hypothetical protein